MAIYELITLAKTSVDNNDYLQADNSVTRKNQRITLASLFPAMATTGSGSESLWISVTNKNQLNFKGLKSADTGLLTVATDTNNLVLTVLEAGIDLSLCNNATAGFLTTVDFTGSATGECPVVSGGTGLSTVAKGSILYASAADTMASAASSTNGQILVHNSTTGVPAWATLGAGTNLTLDTSSAGAVTLNAAYTTATAILDMASFNIDLNDNYISSTGSDGGIRVTGTNTYIGAHASHFNNAVLNIGGGGIEFSDSSSITATAQTGGTTGKTVTVQGGGSAAAAAGGVYITGGTASGNGAGGSVILEAGRDTVGTADGTVQLKTYTGGSSVVGLTVTAEGQDVQTPGNLTITTAGKTIVMSDRTDATQGTNATTAVTNNSASGIITLFGAALASQAEVEFTFTNSVIQSDSVILTGLECAATGRTAGANIQVYFHTKAGGSCKIVVVNTDDVATDAADVFKIHYMVVNNSVT